MKHCNGVMHTIKTGDTLYALSQTYRVPLALLLQANPYVDVYNLQPGETICIPVRRNDKFCDSPYHRNCPGSPMMGEIPDRDVCSTEEKEDLAGDVSGTDVSGTQEEGQPAGDMDSAGDGESFAGEIHSTQNGEQTQTVFGRGNAGMTGISGDDDMTELRWRPDRGEYITRRGDTLERILGVREIPLPAGVRMRFVR